MNEHPQYNDRRPANRLFVATITILTIGIFIFIVTQLAHITPPQYILNSQPNLYRVAHINDGDTIVVVSGDKEETVRFLGIDTPETKDPRKPVQCYGHQASERTKQLLTGVSVRLVPDPINSDRDKYNRWLRYVYLPDGTLVNADLIKNGYAFAYKVFPLTKQAEFVGLETQARSRNAGLWAACQIRSDGKVMQTNDL